MSNYNDRNYKITNSSNIKNPKILWSKPFILGYYTADLEIKFSEESNSIIKKSISFVVIPAKEALILLIFFISVMIMSKKIMQKMKSS